MADHATLPGWPRYLSREEAASYVGVSVTTFDQEVADGQWPAARRRGAKSGRLTWDRQLLDAFADQAAGPLLLAGPTMGQPSAEATVAAAAVEAEAAALRGIENATAKHRTKHRHQKAA